MDGGEDRLPDLEVHVDPSVVSDEDLSEARKIAQRLLLHPEWKAWAKERLEWSEEHLLHDVDQLFPTAPQFETEETFRWLELRSLYPGAEFASELLKSNHDKHLDLDKVSP